MSYQSRFTLRLARVATPTVPLPPRDAQHVLERLRAAYEEAELALTATGDPEERYGWYGYRTDLKDFSRLYPDLLFTLHRAGEENGDLVNVYFSDGRIQECKAVFSYPPYDPAQLKG
jgi:hypothetical protein